MFYCSEGVERRRKKNPKFILLQNQMSPIFKHKSILTRHAFSVYNFEIAKHLVTQGVQIVLVTILTSRLTRLHRSDQYPDNFNI